MGDDTGGIPVADAGAVGAWVSQPGQLQYGPMLLGAGTAAGWRELVGWRDLPGAQASDTPRSQGHGAYPGDVFGDSLTVTFTFLVRGLPGDKLAALNTIERYTRMDGVDKPVIVNDGDGPWMRLGRVIGRTIPMDKAFRHGPLECSVQLLCADPRRYAVPTRAGTVTLPGSVGGLEYPLAYPLDYGTSTSGGLFVTNDGSEDTPPVITFYGPLTNPELRGDAWRLGFTITLADGEFLTVDTLAGTALLNGAADRLYTITPTSDPLERVVLPPGQTDLTLTADSGDGHLSLAYHDARM